MEATRSCFSLDLTSGTLKISESDGSNGPENKNSHTSYTANVNTEFRGSGDKVVVAYLRYYPSIHQLRQNKKRAHTCTETLQL
jgi:hypothetical protein